MRTAVRLPKRIPPSCRYPARYPTKSMNRSTGIPCSNLQLLRGIKIHLPELKPHQTLSNLDCFRTRRRVLFCKTAATRQAKGWKYGLQSYRPYKKPFLQDTSTVVKLPPRPSTDSSSVTSLHILYVPPTYTFSSYISLPNNPIQCTGY